MYHATILLLLSQAPVFPPVKFQPYATGLKWPTAITYADDNSGRMFIAEQRGTVRIVKDGITSGESFLDISDRTTRIKSKCCDERGLLGLAFPPGFAEKKHFYVLYTEQETNTIVISRFSVTDNPDLADPASEEVVIKIPHKYENHFGGNLAFSPADGKLYASLGDGAGGGDPLGSSQDLTVPFAKVLRIDVENGGTEAEPVAMGLRNPWRFSFDRWSGDMYIGDVGEDSFEEVNLHPVGAGVWNYGWHFMEGTHCLDAAACPWDITVFPIFSFDHSEGCAAIAGFVYHGQAFPEMDGIFYFADFCRGALWGMNWRDGDWYSVKYWDVNGMNISTFGEDQAGEIYVADFLKGDIYQMVVDREAPVAEMKRKVRKLGPVTRKPAPALIGPIE